MKLFEIIQTTPKRDLRQSSGDVHSKLRRKFGRFSGEDNDTEGSYANAYPLPGPVPRALRIANTYDDDPEVDGYVAWAKSIEGIKNNPWLPQIDKMRMFGQRNYQHHYHTVMEKLLNFNKVSEKEIQTAFERTFGRPYNKRELEDINSDSAPKRFAIANVFSNAVERYVIYGNDPKNGEPHVEDENLKQAAQIIKALKRKGHTVDLHGGNIMWRRTPHGLQAVIADPVLEIPEYKR